MANEVINGTVQNILERGSKSFKNMKLIGADFHGRNLKGADFSNASIVGADFTDTDLEYANFEGANAYGANFTNSKLRRANFRNASLEETKMLASDLYGVTITLECKSFRGMQVQPGWYYGFLFYGLLMKPPSKEAEEGLIQFLGVERYQTLRSQYLRRSF